MRNKRLPRGFRRGHGDELACPHRDVSVCVTCSVAHDEIVCVAGQHFWMPDKAERESLIAEMAAPMGVEQIADEVARRIPAGIHGRRATLTIIDDPIKVDVDGRALPAIAVTLTPMGTVVAPGAKCCDTCGAPSFSSECTNCWEVHKRLDDFLRAGGSKAADYVLTVLASSFDRAAQHVRTGDGRRRLENASLVIESVAQSLRR